MYLQNTKIGDFKFEGMKSFTYFGSVVNNENIMWTDHSKIMIANCAFVAYVTLFKYKLPSQKIKTKGTPNMTYTDLWVRSLDYDHGRNKCTLEI
jgi:hypothetical protein